MKLAESQLAHRNVKKMSCSSYTASETSSVDLGLVVIGIDESKTAEHAFDWYVKNLHKADNHVLLVHGIVVHPMHVAPSVFVRKEIVKAEYEKEKMKTRGLENKYRMKMIHAGIQGDFLTVQGKPEDVVCQLAREEGAEMIIVGAHGRNKVQRTLLGSVSDQIVHTAHCPVITVRKSVPV